MLRTISSIDAAASATDDPSATDGRNRFFTNSVHATSLSAARSWSFTSPPWFRETQIMFIGILDAPATRCAYRKSRRTRSSYRVSSPVNCDCICGGETNGSISTSLSVLV